MAALNIGGLRMNRFALQLVSSLTALSTATACAAQQPAQAPANSVRPVWTLDWEESHCTISIGDRDRAQLGLWMTPGDPDPQIYLVGKPGVIPRNPGETMTVTLSPGGERYEAEVAVLSEDRPTVLRLSDLRDTFPAAFAKSDEVRLSDGRYALNLPVQGAGKAVGALQGCINDALTQWGVDAKAFAALRKAPTDAAKNYLVSDADYPAVALDRNESGQVVAKLNVDTTGKVTDCAVVVTSGSQALDAATCKAALANGQFEPAIGPDGRPVAAPRVISVRYGIAINRTARGRL